MKTVFTSSGEGGDPGVSTPFFGLRRVSVTLMIVVRVGDCLTVVVAAVVLKRSEVLEMRCEIDVALLEDTRDEEAADVVRVGAASGGGTVAWSGIMLTRRTDGNGDVGDLGDVRDVGDVRDEDKGEPFPERGLFWPAALLSGGISWRGAGLRRLFISDMVIKRK